MNTLISSRRMVQAIGLKLLVEAVLRRISLSRALAASLLAGLLTGLLAATANAAPTVNLTAPANNAAYRTGGTGTGAQANVTVQATATAEPGKTIQRVEFYATLAGGSPQLIGTDPTASYRITWSNVAAGTYNITARAIDSANESTDSAARTITVSGTNTPPTITLSSPPNNARYNLPVAVTFSATVSAVEVNDSLTSVQYLLNGSPVATVTASPWRYLATNLTPGSYVLSAIASDSQGGTTTTSASRSFTIQATNTPPTSTLTGPVNNGVYLQSSLPGGVLNITATAASPETNGSIQKVEFLAALNNGTPQLLGEDTTSPYSFAWTPAAGVYTLTSRSTDDLGAQTTSAPRTVTLTATNQPPTSSLTAPANNAVYKMAGNAANGQPVSPLILNLAANATNPETNGSVTKVQFFASLNGGTPALIGEDLSRAFTLNWTPAQAGVYTLTAKAIDDLNAETVSAARTVTINQNNTPPTATLSSPANNSFYNGTVPAGGGAAVADVQVRATATAGETNDSIKRVELYLNNTLAQTQTTPISGNTYEFNLIGLTVATYSYYVRAVDQDEAGTNSTARTLTVEAANVNRPPIVSLTAPANNSVATAGTSVAVTASANPNEVNGSITSVEFYAARNGGTPTLIGTATAPTAAGGSNFSITWTPAQSGTYVISAKATDNGNASTSTTTNQNRTITVNPAPNQAPGIALNTPTGPFPAPASIGLTATASDADGTVAQVIFFNGAAQIGTGTLTNGTSQNGTWSFTWSNVAQGTYTVTAQATDNSGATTTSNSIQITVTAPTVTSAPPGMYFIEVDHLSTPRLISNQNQQVVWANLNAEPFGDSTPNQNPGGLGLFEFNPRFPGQYFDKETGLSYNYFRDYDSATGRYTKSDPIGLLGGINTYSYVNSPLKEIDPLGLMGRAPGRANGQKSPPAAVPPTRPDGQPWGYGCGDAKTDRIVPDSFGAYNFFSACRKHDICYGTCGASKTRCDIDFLANLNAACQGNSSCEQVAIGYYLGVFLGGQAAFNAAQAEACKECKK